MTDEPLDVWVDLPDGPPLWEPVPCADCEPLLAEVKRLRALVADAWDDGHDAGIDHAHQIYTDNPYRTQPEGDRLTTP